MRTGLGRLYARRSGIDRSGDAFYPRKLQEELGELTRHFLEMTGGERRSEDAPALRRSVEGDCASMIGNALILARRFRVPLDRRIAEKFPAGPAA